MPGAFDLGEMHSLLPGIQRRRNLDSPADEVLRRIFGYIQSSAEVAHPELIIASTTHHWREVALKIPSLWTTVHVNHDRQISVLGDILLRSQNLPLDIYIRLETFKYRFFTDYMEAVNLLIPHVARWRLLSVIAMNPVLHQISARIHHLPMPALEHFELVREGEELVLIQQRQGGVDELDGGEPGEEGGVGGVHHRAEMLDFSGIALDPTTEPRAPSMLAVQRIVLDGSHPAYDRGPAYSPAFSPAHLTSLSIARLAAPTMDLVQALSCFYSTALSAPALRTVSIADIHGHALVMLLSVVRAMKFPPLERL
ncbi:hypothetical protein B0H14DRAFT_3436069 [Mycena olivaceomarginata]|nr:hypothetical protein B0H14DRAFT_3436069 [Mycena olivaceomarginata]